METVDFAARRSRRVGPADGGRGGRAPAPGLRPDARAPRGRARPDGERRPPGPGERARAVARDLHDEANQALTGVLLRLQATTHAPPDLRAELRETQAARRPRRWRSCCASPASCARPPSTTTASRPPCARSSPTSAAAGRCGRAFHRRAGRPQTPSDDGQLVAYRVVPGGPSNIARHAGARRVTVAGGARGRASSCGSTTTGVGFDLDTRRAASASRDARARGARGRPHVHVCSVPGEGTLVEARLRGRRPACGGRMRL